MKYYELHEEFWRQLTGKGSISWDGESKTDLLSNGRNKYLSTFLNETSGNALDLGCGSGSQSFYLSSLGFKCTAVDVSETAINTGRKLAEELGYDIEFHCADVCELDLGKRFDLVTDSCLLHCLVLEEDRKNFFRVARKHMKADGRFFIYTMTRREGQKLFENSDYLHLDANGILWSKGPDRFNVEWTEINGEKYFPHRRIYTPEQQKKEIINNGFEIISERISHPSGEGNQMYIAWLKDKQCPT